MDERGYCCDDDEYVCEPPCHPCFGDESDEGRGGRAPPDLSAEGFGVERFRRGPNGEEREGDVVSVGVAEPCDASAYEELVRASYSGCYEASESSSVSASEEVCGYCCEACDECGDEEERHVRCGAEETGYFAELCAEPGVEFGYSEAASEGCELVGVGHRPVLFGVACVSVFENVLGEAPIIIGVDGDEVGFAVGFAVVVFDLLGELFALLFYLLGVLCLVLLELLLCLALDAARGEVGVLLLDLLAELLEELLVYVLLCDVVESVEVCGLEPYCEAEKEGYEDEGGCEECFPGFGLEEGFGFIPCFLWEVFVDGDGVFGHILVCWWR